MKRQRWASVAAVCAALALVSCGGGDSGGSADGSVNALGSTTAGTIVGTISAFGDLLIHGTGIDDASAAVTINATVSTRERLREGMVVRLRGRIHGDGTGEADSIERFDCVQGPVTAVDRALDTVSVLGQTVHTGDDTVFDGLGVRDVSGLAIGDVVEVSCLHDRAGGRLRATRVERLGGFEDGITDMDITGTVHDLDAVNRTGTVNALAVTFAGIPAADLPAGLSNGMTVRASGRHYAGGVLSADRLLARDRTVYAQGERLVLDGYIERYGSPADFSIDGQPVDASAAVIRNGTAADLGDSVRIEAEGTVQGAVLVARIVTIHPLASVRIEARVQSRDAGASSLVVLGQPVGITADTVLSDRQVNAPQPQRIALSALSAGDRVEVRAWRNGAGTLVAIGVQRTEPEALVLVKAAAQSKAVANRVVLAGIGVATNAATRYLDAAGAPLGAGEFFAAVKVPPDKASVVCARGVVADLSSTEVDVTGDSRPAASALPAD